MYSDAEAKIKARGNKGNKKAGGGAGYLDRLSTGKAIIPRPMCVLSE